MNNLTTMHGSPEFDFPTNISNTSFITDTNTTGITKDQSTVRITSLTYIYVWVGIVNAIVFVLGVIGNILVLALVYRMRDMRTPTNFFLVNLGIADLCIILICQPSALVEFYAKDRWLLGHLACKLVPLLENATVHASVLTILNITVERFNAICNPLKRNLTCTRTSAVKMIIITWIIAFLTAMPFVFMTFQEDAMYHDGSPCKVCRTHIFLNWHLMYVTAIFVIFFVLPLLLLVGMYSQIIRQLVLDSALILRRRGPSALYSLRTRRQGVRMLIAIIALFFITMLPMRILSLWLIFTTPEEVLNLGLSKYLNVLSFARVMILVNSAGNPIIYSLTSSKFRHAFQRMFGKYEPNINSFNSQYSVYSKHTCACRSRCLLSLSNDNQTST